MNLSSDGNDRCMSGGATCPARQNIWNPGEDWEVVADGPTQVMLPVPDFDRVSGVCLGGKDGDTLFAFSGNRIWKRKVKHHAMGAFTARTKVHDTPL
ncbi:sugar lactone lactonase YvrE [Rhodopirellula rubra]|uniref:Sugar lactone lactonase YvrE n=1 Tax=Aporhodopirellula rubra TaxID=980271 RepID=A0A7W5DZL5_9BACT|nr:hypothetical protein [Aporhodopirellula rubra]MBB3207380.1 sugar lactone lactonase YvrE [Aporhodopirellula rubra]